MHLCVGSVLEEVTAAGDVENVDPEQSKRPAKKRKTRSKRGVGSAEPSMQALACMHACMSDSGVDCLTCASDMLSALEALPEPVKIEACQWGKLWLQKLRVEACRACC